MTNFVQYVKDGTDAEKGYKTKIGSVSSFSKVGLSAFTRIQQAEFDKKNPEMRTINIMVPGDFRVKDKEQQK